MPAKPDFLNFLTDDEFTLFAGLGLVIVVFFAIFILSQLMMIPARKRAQIRYANYTGRALGKVLKRYSVSVDDGVDEDGHRKYTTRFIVHYEFTVGGVTYTGSGIGSSRLRDKYETEICYDPDDPEHNCTACFFNSETKSHFWSSLISFAVFFAVLLIGIFVFIRVRR